MLNICFDVDGTLIRFDDTPRYDVIDLMRSMHTLGATIYVWSGGGIEYARHWVDKLGLSPLVKEVVAKGSMRPDIAIDDEKETKLGLVNLWVGRNLLHWSIDHAKTSAGELPPEE